MPDNRGDAVKILVGKDETVRVLIVKRDDGFYAVRPEKFKENIYEGKVIARNWVCLNNRSGIFATAEIAETEARAAYPWISN